MAAPDGGPRVWRPALALLDRIVVEGMAAAPAGAFAVVEPEEVVDAGRAVRRVPALEAVIVVLGASLAAVPTARVGCQEVALLATEGALGVASDATFVEVAAVVALAAGESLPWRALQALVRVALQAELSMLLAAGKAGAEVGAIDGQRTQVVLVGALVAFSELGALDAILLTAETVHALLAKFVGVRGAGYVLSQIVKEPHGKRSEEKSKHAGVLEISLLISELGGKLIALFFQLAAFGLLAVLSLLLYLLHRRLLTSPEHWLVAAPPSDRN